MPKTPLALLFATTILLTACGAEPTASTDQKEHKDDGDDHGDDHDDEAGEAGVYPKEVFTGYDGDHTFTVPVSSVGGKATWTAKDPSMVDLEESTKGVKITTKKAGSTTLTAKIGSKSFTVKVTITEYAAGAWKKGEAVYTETVKCNQCHVTATGPDHSPSEIGKHEDEHLEKRILTGESLHGEDVQSNHKFKAKLADGDLEGVLAYLRALTPGGWPKEAHEH